MTKSTSDIWSAAAVTLDLPFTMIWHFVELIPQHEVGLAGLGPVPELRLSSLCFCGPQLSLEDIHSKPQLVISSWQTSRGSLISTEIRSEFSCFD